jgi:uncharacterized pyridoxamine 5'-phosphate oxidase family protein
MKKILMLTLLTITGAAWAVDEQKNSESIISCLYPGNLEGIITKLNSGKPAVTKLQTLIKSSDNVILNDQEIREKIKTLFQSLQERKELYFSIKEIYTKMLSAVSAKVESGELELESIMKPLPLKATFIIAHGSDIIELLEQVEQSYQEMLNVLAPSYEIIQAIEMPSNNIEHPVLSEEQMALIRARASEAIAILLPGGSDALDRLLTKK